MFAGDDKRPKNVILTYFAFMKYNLIKIHDWQTDYKIIPKMFVFWI